MDIIVSVRLGSASARLRRLATVLAQLNKTRRFWDRLTAVSRSGAWLAAILISQKVRQCYHWHDGARIGGYGAQWGQIRDATAKGAGMTYNLEVEREREEV